MDPSSGQSERPLPVGPACRSRLRSFRIHHLPRLASDHQLLVGLHHANSYRAAVGRDDWSVGGVAGWVDADAQEIEALAESGADRRRVLAHAGGEDERVETTR